MYIKKKITSWCSGVLKEIGQEITLSFLQEYKNKISGCTTKLTKGRVHKGRSV